MKAILQSWPTSVLAGSRLCDRVGAVVDFDLLSNSLTFECEPAIPQE